MSNTKKILGLERRLQDLEAYRLALQSAPPIVETRQAAEAIESRALVARADLRGLPLPMAALAGDSELARLESDAAALDEQIAALGDEIAEMRPADCLAESQKISTELTELSQAARTTAIDYLESWAAFEQRSTHFEALKRQADQYAYQSQVPPVYGACPAAVDGSR